MKMDRTQTAYSTLANLTSDLKHLNKTIDDLIKIAEGLSQQVEKGDTNEGLVTTIEEFNHEVMTKFAPCDVEASQ